MTALLVIIFLAFISLGLPDSILGSAWPVIRMDLSASVSTVGYVTMIVSASTVVASLLNHRIVSRFGTARVVTIGVLLAATAMLGYSSVGHVGLFFLFAIPLGLGNGSIDASLNNFMALHGKPIHMNWMHCFWGLGATLGPIIMSIFLDAPAGWRTGYLVVAGLQASLVVVLFLTRGLWQGKDPSYANGEKEKTTIITNREALAMPNVKLALVAFGFFSILEVTAGLWSSSYLVAVEGMGPVVAARWTASFYAGITVGRFIAGFLSMKVGNTQMIRVGQIICVVGALFLLLPLPATVSALGFLLIGLGSAPIFPAMIHETPHRFGAASSGAIIGLQMAVAFSGGTVGSPLFGLLSSVTSLKLLPYFLMLAILTMLVATELLNRRLAAKEKLA